MIPHETSTFEAIAFAAKRLIPHGVASKVGFWRPVIVAVLGYQEWDRQDLKHRHEHRINQVESFVTSPPTNGRAIHESEQLDK